MKTLELALPPELRLRHRLAIEPVGRMAFGSRGDRLLASGLDLQRRPRDGAGELVRDTLVVDLIDGAVRETWSGYWYCAIGVGWGDSFVAGANDAGFIDMWRFGRAQPGWPKQKHDGRIGALVFSDDRRRFFSGGDDGRIGLWSAGGWEARFVDAGGLVADLAHDAVGDRLAVATGAGAALLDAGDGRRVGGVRAPGRATAVAFAGGGAVLYVGTREGRLGRFDVARGEPLAPSAALGLGAIWRVLPMGALMVVEAADGVALLDGASGRLRVQWRTHAGSRGATLAVDAAQRTLAVAVPAGVAVVDCDVAAARPAVEVVALFRADDGEAAAVVVGHLRAAGALVRERLRTREAILAAGREGVVVLVLVGAAGVAPEVARAVGELQAEAEVAATGARVVPVVLPGGDVMEAQKLGDVGVRFGERVHDRRALEHVLAAVGIERE